MLLYPDPTREQPDNPTTCFAAPIEICDWMHMKGRAVGSRNSEYRDQLNDMPYLVLSEDLYYMRSTGEDGYDSLAILLRDNEDADTCLESAAWIRVKHEFNGMIYICRPKTTADEWQSFAAITSLGVDEAYVAMVDLVTVKPQED